MSLQIAFFIIIIVNCTAKDTCIDEQF